MSNFQDLRGRKEKDVLEDFSLKKNNIFFNFFLLSELEARKLFFEIDLD